MQYVLAADLNTLRYFLEVAMHHKNARENDILLYTQLQKKRTTYMYSL